MIKPVGNNILVKCFEGDKISDGGIIVPESVYKESNKVKVVATGNGTKKTPMQFKEGDIGYRVKDWGFPLDYNGERFYIMEQSAIIAKELKN